MVVQENKWPVDNALALSDSQLLEMLTARGASLVNGTLAVPDRSRVVCEMILRLSSERLGLLTLATTYGIPALRLALAEPELFSFDAQTGTISANYRLGEKAKAFFGEKGILEYEAPGPLKSTLYEPVLGASIRARNDSAIRCLEVVIRWKD